MNRHQRRSLESQARKGTAPRCPRCGVATRPDMVGCLACFEWWKSTDGAFLKREADEAALKMRNGFRAFLGVAPVTLEEDFPRYRKAGAA